MSETAATIKYPKWIHELTPELQAEEKLKFLLRLAAVHASPDGTILGLCAALGKSRAAFQAQFRGFNNQPLNIKLAIEIEKLVGADVVSRQDLCPHIFS